ncbi:MAG: LysR family transcriptional regulator [Clostridia bacterium]|nr:LysR family transcriptional regulator [Clostridia bacterium]
MFREMRYVMEVYRQRSFSKAATKLYVSQPSLSLMVKKVEEKLGGPIFDRSTSPIGLTEMGREYIRCAQQIQEIEMGFEQYLSDAEQCLTGTLSLGGTMLFASYVLPPMISAFSARYPGVTVKLTEGHTDTLERELQAGGLDVVVENYAFDPAVFESRPYQRERVMLAVPTLLAPQATRSYALTAEEVAAGQEKEAVPLDMFQDLPFLMLKAGNDTRKRGEELCEAAGFRPHIRLLLDQQISAYNLAAYGLGAAFVSDTLVRLAPGDSRLLFYHLSGDRAYRYLYFVYKRNRVLTRPVEEFLKMLE